MGQVFNLRRQMGGGAAPLPEDAIDLGLPSGKLWCSHDIGAVNPEDYGLYFSYANVVGHVGGEYDFSSANYQQTTGYQLSGNIPANATYDAAVAIMGGKWRMPTQTEVQELVSNTDFEWTANYNGTGIKGKIFYKKTDHSIFIFMPACGYCTGTKISYLNSIVDIWLSNQKYFGGSSSNTFGNANSNSKYFGMAIRAIYDR
jgi:hypothetical protein